MFLALAMLVGCICGFYTTVALTTPLVYVWTKGALEELPKEHKPAHKARATEKKAVVAETEEKPAPAQSTAKKAVRKSRRNRR